MVCGHGIPHGPEMEARLRFLTFIGRDVALLTEAPDWKDSFDAEFSLLATQEQGLSGRESRRAMSIELRTRLGFSVTSADAEARGLASGLKQYQNQLLGVPFWPGLVEWSERAGRKIGGGVNLVYREDWSQWELYLDGSEPVWPVSGDLVVPVLFGRMEQRALRWPSPSVATLDVSFTEASPSGWGLRVTDATFEAGVKPSEAYSFTPSVFPTQVHFDQADQSFNVEIERSTIGFGREDAETLYQESTGFSQGSDHIAEGADEIGKLLAFFKSHGAGKPFWVPTWTSAVELSEDVGALVTAILVEDTVGVEPGEWLAFLREDGTIIRKVLSKASEAVFLESAPGETPLETLVCHAKLVRWAKPAMKVQWLCRDVIRMALNVREVPEEYTPAADEDLGISLGLVPHKVFLYEITKTVGDAEVIERLTSHEDDVELDGVTYTAAKVTHGSIRQGIALERDQVELTIHATASQILKEAATLKSNGPVKLVILESYVTRVREFGDDYSEEDFS